MRGRDWKNSRVQAPLPDSGLAGALLRASQGNPQGMFGTAPRGKTAQVHVGMRSHGRSPRACTTLGCGADEMESMCCEPPRGQRNGCLSPASAGRVEERQSPRCRQVASYQHVLDGDTALQVLTFIAYQRAKQSHTQLLNNLGEKTVHTDTCIAFLS